MDRPVTSRKEDRASVPGGRPADGRERSHPRPPNLPTHAGREKCLDHPTAGRALHRYRSLRSRFLPPQLTSGPNGPPTPQQPSLKGRRIPDLDRATCRRSRFGDRPNSNAVASKNYRCRKRPSEGQAPIHRSAIKLSPCRALDPSSHDRIDYRQRDLRSSLDFRCSRQASH